MAPEYRPVLGPQHRRRLLRELGRQGKVRNFGVSPREVRRSTARLFAFEPLVPVSASEKNLLKKFAAERSKYAVKHFTENARDILSGKRKIIEKRGALWAGKTGPVRRETIRAFSNPKVYDNTRLQIGGSDFSVVLQASRSMGEYLGYSGIDVLDLSQSAYARKHRTIRVLDLGSANSKALNELRRIMKGKVETHALSPEDEPRHKTDYFHFACAEYLPASFRGKFDVIVSHRALEYSLFPNLALANIARALAPEGRAVLQWRPGQTAFNKLSHEDLSFFSRYREAAPSSDGIKLILDSEHRPFPRTAVEAKIASGIQKDFYYGLGGLQTMAWCNEIARLQKSKSLSVKIIQHYASNLGFVPGIIVIERKK